MEHNRKQKISIILALILSIASLSLGSSAFSTTLSISSNASVSTNADTLGVKFSTNKDTLVVNDIAPSDNPYNLETTNGKIDNSTHPTISNISATFTEPGQYVEYTFYARNEGEYTAYLNSINYISEKICTPEEDTPWYNDRSIGKTLSEGDVRFSPYIRNASSLDETIPVFDENSLYKLMVSNTNINDKLLYPIALLTADELTASGTGWFGYSAESYLNAGVKWWTMSPDFYNQNSARCFYVTAEGRLMGLPVTNTTGV